MNIMKSNFLNTNNAKQSVALKRGLMVFSVIVLLASLSWWLGNNEDHRVVPESAHKIFQVVDYGKLPQKGVAADKFNRAILEAEANLKSTFSSENILRHLDADFPGKGGISPDREEKLKRLRDDVLNGFFMVPVRFISWNNLNGAMAAFAGKGPEGKPVIFINEEYLSGLASPIYPAASVEQIASLLLQEIGHSFDYLLNGDNDSPGDEGFLFSSESMGISPDIETLASNADRNDSNIVEIKNDRYVVEEAAIVVSVVYPATQTGGQSWTTQSSQLQPPLEAVSNAAVS